jgi:hypothetical protein
MCPAMNSSKWDTNTLEVFSTQTALLLLTLLVWLDSFSKYFQKQEVEATSLLSSDPRHWQCHCEAG